MALYRYDSVVITSFVGAEYTTRRWGWVLGRISYSTTRHYPLYSCMCENGANQRVAQHRDNHTFTMMMKFNVNFTTFSLSILGKNVIFTFICWVVKCWCIRSDIVLRFQICWRFFRKTLNIQSGPKKCIHSLLINSFGINLNEISISGWECNIMFSQQMAQALL